MFIGRTLLRAGLILSLIAGAWPGPGLAASSVSDRAVILSHDLVVELIPASHELMAHDHVELEIPRQVTSVAFTLAPTLHIESIVLQASLQGPLSFSTDHRAASFSEQQVIVALPAGHDTRVSLQWNYRGVIDDPPREPRHLRFVTPSETAGHIGPEGVYLSSESQWYPDIEGSLSTYRILARAPEGWTVVTQGVRKEQATGAGRTASTWETTVPSEALTLVANRFITKSREWKGPTGQRVALATYFFPDNAGMADEYLEATAKYLDAYVPLLGDYPFEKFAIVENFFASGLGMPSFTLLGSGSIKRHYVQPYALGHEIVHSWIGNSVLNRTDQGNWVEGLTTYLANYYWHELVRDPKQTVEQRRLMMQTFSVYVEPERDYPVGRFQRKSDERDNAIGYQKSAFVFHLLRQEIGDDAFFRGLKVLTSRYRNRFADWSSLETLFARESHEDLRWFFEQWIEQAGAPSLSLGDISARPAANGGTKDAWRMTVRVRQAGAPFRITVPVHIETGTGTEVRSMTLDRSPEATAEFLLPQQPRRVALDPDLMIFRRFERNQLPPMLNGYVTDPHRILIRAFSDPASPLQQIVARVADQESTLAESERTVVLRAEEAMPASHGSILVLADVDQWPLVRPIVAESCSDVVRLDGADIEIDGQKLEGPTTAVLFSCHRANVPGSVVTVLYGMTPRAVVSVSRFLFYYGWQSYVIFREGSAAKRGLWQVTQELKEVRIDGDR